LLIGDAAGTVSPLTAGGIQPAYEIGQAAGHAIVDYLQSDGPRPEIATKKLMPGYGIKRRLRKFYSRHPFSNKTFNRMLNSRWFRSVAQAVFFHNRGLFSWAAWKDIFRSQRKNKALSSKR
jgi:flavin-dependent dehydrogenase